MHRAWVRAAALLLLGSVMLAAGSGAEPSLVVGLVAALLVFCAAAALPVPGETASAASARERRRALARRAVPRQRDPDAPGRARSRAPSGSLPAV
jgi:Family of unknown function (DUF6412)